MRCTVGRTAPHRSAPLSRRPGPARPGVCLPTAVWFGARVLSTPRGFVDVSASRGDFDSLSSEQYYCCSSTAAATALLLQPSAGFSATAAGLSFNSRGPSLSLCAVPCFTFSCYRRTAALLRGAERNQTLQQQQQQQHRSLPDPLAAAAAAAAATASLA